MRACVFLDWRPDIVSSARFVLIVEKDATFQRLLDDDFCAKLSPCIMITVRFPSVFLLFFFGGGGLHPHSSTQSSAPACVDQGKGVPDVNSRLMVRKLWDTLHIPVFALVDADPHGRPHLSGPRCPSSRCYFLSVVLITGADACAAFHLLLISVPWG